MANLKIRRVQGEGKVSGLSVPGLNYPLRFDENGICIVDQADYDKWVKGLASSQSVFVVGPTTEKSQEQKDAAKRAKKPGGKK